ncbi:aldehyde dehydrogenase family protein [Deltaproteobacteria bacterium TL4]
MTTLKSYSPVTGELLGEVPAYTFPQIATYVTQAHEVQDRWGRLPLKNRIEALKKIKKILIEHADELIEQISQENGKVPFEVCSSEILSISMYIDDLITRSPKILEEYPLEVGLPFKFLKRSFISYEPRGVVAVISPWNHPLVIAMKSICGALLTGNAVIWKPSEYTPLTAVMVERLIAPVLPKDLFKVVTGDGRTGEALVNAEIDMVAFTGSVTTGKKVAQIAAQKLIPCVLEMGGKDPFLVLRDANLDRAAKAAVWSAFFNQGQVCSGTERVYVHESILGVMIRKIVEETKKLRQGKGGFDTEIGPMIHEGQLKIVLDQIAEAKQLGAKVLCGGEVDSSLGPLFLKPTVMVDVRHDMKIMREETFGPVLPIQPFKTLEDAVNLANDSPYGLTASIWTKDEAQALMLARYLKFGTVTVNDVSYAYNLPGAPWCGRKESGLGRGTSGHLGLLEFVDEKHIGLSRIKEPKQEFWWYPYNQTKYKILRSMNTLLNASGLDRFKIL